MSDWQVGLDRARSLLGTPHAVRILESLHRGRWPPRSLPRGVSPKVVTEAVRLLLELDLVCREPATTPQEPERITLTVRGEELIAVLMTGPDDNTGGPAAEPHR